MIRTIAGAIVMISLGAAGIALALYGCLLIGDASDETMTRWLIGAEMVYFGAVMLIGCLMRLDL